MKIFKRTKIKKYSKDGRILFTKEMKKEYTILIPMMLPIHFKFMKNILVKHGYKAELLNTSHSRIIEEGLQNVHNDTCYPALLVIGQMIDALNSGKYDLNGFQGLLQSPHVLEVLAFFSPTSKERIQKRIVGFLSPLPQGLANLNDDLTCLDYLLS